MTEEERARAERMWRQTYDYEIRWYEADTVETRHYGVRYCGRFDGFPILAFPEAKGATAQFTFRVLQYSGLNSFAKVGVPEDVIAAVERYHEAFEAAILAGDGLDDPLRLDGQDLPPLGECPLSADELPDGLRADQYLGTYHGCSVFFYRDLSAADTTATRIGGVPFWHGEYYAFRAYQYGKVYRLEEAFLRGYLTYEDLRAVAGYAYGETFPEAPVTVSPGNAPVVIAPKMPEITPLTEEQIAAIETAWLSTKGYPVKWYEEANIITRHFGLRYYGTCGEYVILFAPETKLRTSYISLGDGQYLKHSTEFSLYAYRDGTLYEASERYKAGALSDAELACVIACHDATEYALKHRPDWDDPLSFDGPIFPPLGPITEEVRAAVGEHQTVLSHYTYCGIYNGSAVFVMKSMIRSVSEHIIGGKYFSLEPYVTVVLREGVQYSLEDAFNLNFLTVEDIEKIEYYVRTQMGYGK